MRFAARRARRRSSSGTGRSDPRDVWDTGSVTDDPLERISVDPAVCHGQPCVRGTRVLVTVVLDALAAGHDTDEILGHSPTLTAEGVRAAAA